MHKKDWTVSDPQVCVLGTQALTNPVREAHRTSGLLKSFSTHWSILVRTTAPIKWYDDDQLICVCVCAC